MHREPATRYRLLFHRNDICSVSRTIVAEIYWKKNNQEILSKKLHEKRVDKSRWLSHFVALALASSPFSAFLLIFNYEDRLFCPTTTLQRFNARTYEKWWLFLFAQISSVTWRISLMKIVLTRVEWLDRGEVIVEDEAAEWLTAESTTSVCRHETESSRRSGERVVYFLLVGDNEDMALSKSKFFSCNYVVDTRRIKLFAFEIQIYDRSSSISLFIRPLSCLLLSYSWGIDRLSLMR